MRGTVVDFDLIDIKNQMAKAPKTADVHAREDFVDRRLRRRQRMAERAKQALDAKAEVVDVEPETPVVKEEEEVLAHVKEEVVAPEPEVEKVEVKKPVTKKKAAKKKAVVKKKTTRKIKKKTEDSDETKSTS
jgi:hypothetical protein